MGALVPAAIHPATDDPVLQRMAADVARAEARVFTVRFQHVYGRVTCYPVDRNAVLCTRIAGTKTLLPDHLTAMRQMGFELRLADGSKELLEEYLRGGA